MSKESREFECDLTRSEVSEYYGKILTKSADLKTTACCTADKPPQFVISALGKIHDDVLSRYYGCGIIVPDLLTGLRVLDLGCGAGRDCYILSQLVGENGSVVGVDMTEELLQVARSVEVSQAAAFGYAQPNTQFLTGLIERLDELPSLQAGSFDVVVSNCVVNLTPDKEAVFRQAHRLLKTGGEMYFSDVYGSQRIPGPVRSDPVLWGECLAGALYWNDFLHLAKRCGFSDPRLVSSAPIAIRNEEIERKLGGAKFYSVTYRLFKLEGLEPDCEDFGQAVRYKGTLPAHTVSATGEDKDKDTTAGTHQSSAQHTLDTFVLDARHSFTAHKIYPVCGNTFKMLAETRFAPHFDLFGDDSRHFGVFPGCGKSIPFADGVGGKKAGGSCC